MVGIGLTANAALLDLLRASSGQPAEMAKEEIAKILCMVEYPIRGVGKIVRPNVQSAETKSAILAGIAKLLAKTTTTTVRNPPKTKNEDMISLTGDSGEASSLIVCLAWSYPGHIDPAIIQPKADWIGPIIAAYSAILLVLFTCNLSKDFFSKDTINEVVLS
jgi:hypothetical protein